MAKLRGGTAEWSIETGRWIGLEREEQDLWTMWLKRSGEYRTLRAEV